MRWVEGAKIVAMTTLAAITYGVAHDLITAHICVEYFSVWHPNPLDLQNPVQLALFWGVLATWWMGAGLGLALAVASRAGDLPKLEWRDILTRVVWLIVASAVLAAIAGFLAYRSGGVASMLFDVQHIYPGEKGQRFEAVLAAHNVSYAVSFFGALILCGFTLRRRKLLSMHREPEPAT